MLDFARLKRASRTIGRRARFENPVVFKVKHSAESVSSTFFPGAKPRYMLLVGDRREMTSDEQFAPLFRFASELKRAFNLRIHYADVASALEMEPEQLAMFSIVGLKLSFRTPADAAVETVREMRKRTQAVGARLVYFDGDDDSNVQWPPLLDCVDLYVKKHVYASRDAYSEQYIGKSNLTDWVAKTYDVSFENNIIPRSGGLPRTATEKIILGWNIGLDDKIYDIRNISRSMPSLSRDIDVSARASAAPDDWIYPLRAPVAKALQGLSQRFKVTDPTKRIPPSEFYAEMLRSKIWVSPFGYGELCWRDFEAILCRCLLVKPDMSHIQTSPDVFQPGVTYVPCKWDFSDLEEVCARYLADEPARRAIADRAFEVLKEAMGSAWFVDRFARLLERLDMQDGSAVAAVALRPQGSGSA